MTDKEIDKRIEKLKKQSQPIKQIIHGISSGTSIHYWGRLPR